jgi:hypothetical protein
MPITVHPGSIPIISTPTQPINVTVPRGKKGDKGDKGDPGQDALWEEMTQAEYNALPTKDPNTLYVIIG